MNERAIVLLKACRDLLNKQHNTAYVINLLDETVYYDDAECSGSCLIEDIDVLLVEIEKSNKTN